MKHFVLGVFAAATLVTAAQADPVRYDFAGSLKTDQTGSGFAAEAGLASGTGSFSGHITFSDLAPDTDPSTAEFYEPSEFELIIGSYTFSGANLGFDSADARIDPSAPGFFLDFFSGSNFSAINGESMALFLSFASAGPGIVQNPDPAGATANLILGGDDDFLFAEGAVTRISTTATESAVPEPATWATLLGGFAIVGAAMRRRRRTLPGRALT